MTPTKSQSGASSRTRAIGGVTRAKEPSTFAASLTCCGRRDLPAPGGWRCSPTCIAGCLSPKAFAVLATRLSRFSAALLTPRSLQPEAADPWRTSINGAARPRCRATLPLAGQSVRDPILYLHARHASALLSGLVLPTPPPPRLSVPDLATTEIDTKELLP